MGSCQNYGPFLGTLNNRCRIIIGTQKGPIILTTTHIPVGAKRIIMQSLLSGSGGGGGLRLPPSPSSMAAAAPASPGTEDIDATEMGQTRKTDL